MAAPDLIIERRPASPRQTMALGRRFAKRLRGGDVIGLEGVLGAGKTCFVRGLAAGLGVHAQCVSSPTFVLCHLLEGKQLRLAHLDAYRIHSLEELQGIGMDELLEDSRTVVAAEWADRIPAGLPARRITVRFEHLGPGARRVTFSAPPELADRIEHLA